MLDYTEITVALISLVGVLATVARSNAKVKREKAKVAQAEDEIKFQKAAMGFGEFLTEWNEIQNEVNRLFKETKLERFIIFQAFNGKLTPRWTTGVIQLRKDSAPISFVHVELDEDYIGRLLSIRSTRFATVKPTELGPCMIKDIYMAEGVTESLWAHIKTKQLDPNRTVYTYCSYATTDAGGMDETTMTMCKNLTGRLKSIALNFPGAQG